MRIGELAERTTLSRDTIRFYERNGLIHSVPGEAPSNSYRDYPDETVERLAMIREAQNAGFSISELAQFISQLEGSSAEAGFDVEAFLERKISEVEDKIRRSEKFLDALRATKRALARPDTG